jgi:hypothetical protein
MGVLPKGILTPSFIEIAPAVTKRALLMDDDDDDGRYVIVKNYEFTKNHLGSGDSGIKIA